MAFATGRRGPDPTHVQTSPEIRANPLNSFFILLWGCPMYAYCNFYCSLAKRQFLTPHFFELATPLCISFSNQPTSLKPS